MKPFFCGVIFLFFGMISAQNTITGRLTNEKGKPVYGVSVTLGSLSSESIIAYDLSDEKGMYHITFSTTENLLNLNLQKIGFKPISVTVPNQNLLKDFALKKVPISLDEVVVVSRPIEKKGDTLRYRVRSFANALKDRSIADVLDNMPGISVGDNGAIYFQGEAINKFYIEGLDLLGGRYALASENLPFEKVSEVQILKDHQPIKVLEGLKSTGKAALNIKLKNKYTFTGKAKIGGGLPLWLWQLNLTPMLFSPKNQMLFSYQTNNTGKKIEQQLQNLLGGKISITRNSTQSRHDWLRLQQIKAPDFSQKRWLNNNAHLFSANLLQPMAKDFNLRINASYFNNFRQQRGETSTLFFTPTDSLFLLEKANNNLYDSVLKTEIRIAKNTPKTFLKNRLSFKGFWNHQNGYISGNHPIRQVLRNDYFQGENQFKSIFKIGEELVSLSSEITLSKTPQELKVTPGPFTELLNNGQDYAVGWQKVALSNFQIHNEIGLTKGWRRFTFSPKIGGNFTAKHLKTNLFTSGKKLSGIFQNDLSWKSSKIYGQLNTQYHLKKLTVNLKLPVSWRSYTIKDISLNQHDKLEKWVFEPSLSLRYATGFWDFRAATGINHFFGDIRQFHYGYILKSYRYINRTRAPLRQQENQYVNGKISYNNITSFFFGHLFYEYAERQSNLLYQTQLLPDGATVYNALAQKNTSTNKRLLGKIGKTFSALNTTLSIRGHFNTSKTRLLLNTVSSDLRTTTWGFGTALETHFKHWFLLDYKADWVFSNSRLGKKENSTLSRQNHQLGLHFFPVKNLHFGINLAYTKNELLQSRSSDYFFADALLKYTWKERNLSFGLNLNNLFNIKTYSATTLSAFSYVQTHYRLRPRQILFSVDFSL